LFAPAQAPEQELQRRRWEQSIFCVPFHNIRHGIKAFFVVMLESVLFFADTVGFFAMKSQEAANLRSFHFALRLELTWTRDQCFPASYAHATWGRLAPFFQLPGVVTSSQQKVSVELRPFNDRQYNRDLLLVCQRVNEKRLHLPDGRLLLFAVKESARQGFAPVGNHASRSEKGEHVPLLPSCKTARSHLDVLPDTPARIARVNTPLVEAALHRGRDAHDQRNLC